ncbi:hypothetical protein NDA13_000312 [Ustilago tritici]|nr:hypothetical protein NDA13_000312 [Ustilago tritici]
MAPGSGLQRSRAPSQIRETGPSRSSDRSTNLFLGNSPSSQETRASSRQPAISRPTDRGSESRDSQINAVDEAAARRARRQERREEEAYQVKGWEDLYGGGGGRPVFSRDQLPTRSAAASSLQKDVAAAKGSHSKDKTSYSQTQSSLNRGATLARRSARSPSSSRLPSSTAPASSRAAAVIGTSATRLGKRKAPSPDSASTKRSSRSATARSKEPAVEQEDSDDDFEMTGFVLASQRPRVHDDTDVAIIAKISPSPSEACKISRTTPTAFLRRSISKTPAPSQRGPSAALSLPPDQGRSPAASLGLSPGRSCSRDSRASSSSRSSPDQEKLTPKQTENITRLAIDAFANSTSLAEHVRTLTRSYSAMLGVAHPEQPAVDELECKLANLEPEAGFNDVHNVTKATPTVPSGLRQRLAVVFRTYAFYLTRGHDHERSPAKSAAAAAPSATAESDSALSGTASATAHDNGASEAEASAPMQVMEAESAPALATATSESRQSGAEDPVASPQAAETRSDVVTPEANAEGDQMQVEPTAEPEEQIHCARDADDELANADHESTIESAGSLQAFGTLPEEPVDGPEEADEGAQADESAHRRARAEDAEEADELEEEEDELVDEVMEEAEKMPNESVQPTSHHQDDHGDEIENEQPIMAQPIGTDDGNAAVDQQAVVGNESAAAGQQVDILQEAVEDRAAVEKRDAEKEAEQQQEQSEYQNAQQKVQQEDQQEDRQGDQQDVQQEVQLEDEQAIQQQSEQEPSEQQDEQQHEQSEHQSEPQHDPQENQQSEQPMEHGSEQPLHTTSELQSEEQDGNAPQAAASKVEMQRVGQPHYEAPQPSNAPVSEDKRAEALADDPASAVDQGAEQVATEVEEVEQALAASADAQPNQNFDAITDTTVIASVTNASTEEVDEISAQAGASAETAGEGSRITVSDPPTDTVTTGCAASSWLLLSVDAAAVTEADEGMPHATEMPLEASAANSSLAEPRPEADAESSTQAPAVAKSTETTPTEEPRNSPVAAAAVALANIPETISSSQEAESISNTAPVEVAADDRQPTSAQVTANPVNPAISSTGDAQADEPAAGPSHEAGNPDWASSQAASDSATPVARRKKTVADRMKPMLRDLANITGRQSSYDTIQKLKPLRTGAATDRTVADLVERWQDPANIIPWTCLQEVGPNILHPRAHRYENLSMHELMDRVSNTRSVKFITSKLPERIITRALMEFPRIPHMLHCWNNEKFKYFVSRGLPQPTDTQPEFRFADAADVPGASSSLAAAAITPASSSRASAPPPTTTSSLDLEVPEKKPQLARGNVSASPMSAPAMTHSHFVPPPSNSEVGRLHVPVPLTAVPAPQKANQPVDSNVMRATAVAQLMQSQQPNGGNAGSLSLVPPRQQNLQMLPASLPPAQPVQHLSVFEQQQRQLIMLQQQQQFRQFQPPPPQKLTLQKAFQHQTNQPHSISRQPPQLSAAALSQQQEATERQQRMEQLMQQQQRQQQRQLQLQLQLQLQQQQQQQVQQLQQQQLQQQQQQQQQQQSTATQIASAVRAAASAIFAGLAADCVSFAEHVLGTGVVAEEIVSRDHFSESEVLHVVQYVLNVYKDEVNAERAAGRQNQQAEERYAKVLKVQEAAMRVVSLTKTLLGIKMCVNEAVKDALRSQIGMTLPSEVYWQDLLSMSSKFKGIVEYLMRGEPMVLHRLSVVERRILMQHKVVAVNKDLELTLEKIVSMDDLGGTGSAASGTNAEGEGDEGIIKRECEMIAGICCKHVVDILSD